MLAGIKDILIIVNKGSISQFKKILLNEKIWVLKLDTLNKINLEVYLTLLNLEKIL